MQSVIGDITKNCIVVTPETKCEDIYSIFEENASIEGIVVGTKEHPIGIVMKINFFQKLSTKYGFDLYMKRNIELVMDHELLMVDYFASITEVSSLAMKRQLENIYDLVIVTKKGYLYGIVSIRELIIKLSEVQISIARFSNPLSGLPGNNVIEETLQKVLTYERFSVLYLDIDTFKVFNDTFGFSEGDELIKETATIISETILTIDNDPSFVGHIGGDDFIAVLPHYCHEEICREIITRFDRFILQFYTDEEINKGYIQAVTRKGNLENVPLVSISIAVVQNRHDCFTSVGQLSKMAAKLKKNCKYIPQSAFLTVEECKA
jgi:diguanylate cyclase (GGDEF)-like protein